MLNKYRWTPQEKWVWERIKSGEDADFNQADGYGGYLDPDKDKGWTEKRILRPEFLQTILLENAYVKDIPRRGVCIIGAYIRDPLDLSHGVIGYPLILYRSRFEAHVVFSDAHARSFLSFEGSVCMDKLDMNRIHVEKDLFLRNRAKFQNVELLSARIDGQMDMTDVAVEGKMNMGGLQVGLGLFMRNGATFQDVDLRSARIDGQVDMTDATVKGTLNMNSLQVGALILRDGANFKEPVKLTYAVVEQTMELQGSAFHTVNLQGTEVKGDLFLYAEKEKEAKWQKGAVLDLNAAKVGILRDSEDSWPEKVELDGFVYDRWGGYSGEDPGGFHTRPVKWFKDWLKKDRPFRPQPYEQLAKVLRESGHPEKAKAILYASKEEERKEAKGLHKRFWMWLLKWTVGYGYRIYLALLLIIIYILTGLLVLMFDQQVPLNTIWNKLAFSIDMMLHFIKLEQSHYAIELTGFSRLYFCYFHKLIGYVLASILIASITGLTKK